MTQPASWALSKCTLAKLSPKVWPTTAGAPIEDGRILAVAAHSASRGEGLANRADREDEHVQAQRPDEQDQQTLCTTSPAHAQRTASSSAPPVRHSGGVITVMLRFDHHVDHTFLEATDYRDDEGVLTVYLGEQEVARFPTGSWDGVYRHETNRVREKDGSQRTAQRLEVQLPAAD